MIKETGERSSAAMKFDDIMITIGEFGRYQRRTYNLCCLFAFLTAFHLLASVFITGSADHWCKVGCDVRTPGSYLSRTDRSLHGQTAAPHLHTDPLHLSHLK